MKHITAMAALTLLLVTGAKAQTPKRVALTARSTVPASIIMEDMAKTCHNVVLTLDTSKADFFLEAAETESRAEFTLFNRDGDALYHTETRKYKSAVKDVCSFIETGKK
jgi:hypothetical protein